MVTPIPTFPNQSPSTASFYGSLSKLFLYDSRGVGLTFAFWKPEPLPQSFAGAQGSKVYFKPGTAAISFPASASSGGSSFQAELTFETTDDSPEVLAWLTSLLSLPLFALAYPVGAGLIRGFQSLQLSFEYKNTGKYEDAPRYLVSLKSKGLVKIWYLSSGASNGHVLPYDPDDSNSVEPNLNAFDEGFDEGFIKP